jgi:hypothetical protein
MRMFRVALYLACMFISRVAIRRICGARLKERSPTEAEWNTPIGALHSVRTVHRPESGEDSVNFYDHAICRCSIPVAGFPNLPNCGFASELQDRLDLLRNLF